MSEPRRTEGGWEVEVRQIGSAAFPLAVEAETASGMKQRRVIDRLKRVNLVNFETGEELKSVVIDPDGVCPDLNESDNRWTSAGSEEAK